MMDQGKSVRTPLPEEEGPAETTWNGLTTDPIHCPFVLLWRRKDRKCDMNLRSGRREWCREGVIRFSFHFPLPYSGLIGNKLN